MPHVIVETSQNLTLTQPDSLLKSINHTLWQTNQFNKPTDIKARLYQASNSLIGLEVSDDKFICVHFYLMPGRDDTTKSLLVRQIFDAIVNHVKVVEKIHTADNLQITINLIELESNYFKQLV